MPKQRHIGFVIFSLCCAISARLAFFDPEPHVPSPAEERWGAHQDTSDTLRIIHGVRYYIYGLGVVGLLMVVEDEINAQLRKKRESGATTDPSNKTEKQE